MNDTKAWWQSRGVWGSLVAIGAGAVGVTGINLDAPIQAELTDILISGATLAGGAVALYGRIKAVAKVIVSKNS